MGSIDLSSVQIVLTPTGRGSRIEAGGVEISSLVEAVEVRSDVSGGTRVELKMGMVDCRVSGRGSILAPHPSSGELLEVAEIRFKNGDRWKAVTESSEK